MAGSDDFYSASKLWFAIRASLGELNSRNVRASEDNKNFFDTKDESIEYPQRMRRPHKPVVYMSDDPFAHLGKIGYTRNTYQFKGEGREDNNIYGSNHMKKMLYWEEVRRRIVAEEIGISADIDETSIAKETSLYYINDSAYTEAAPRPKKRGPLNQYYQPGRKYHVP